LYSIENNPINIYITLVGSYKFNLPYSVAR